MSKVSSKRRARLEALYSRFNLLGRLRREGEAKPSLPGEPELQLLDSLRLENKRLQEELAQVDAILDQWREYDLQTRRTLALALGMPGEPSLSSISNFARSLASSKQRSAAYLTSQLAKLLGNLGIEHAALDVSPELAMQQAQFQIWTKMLEESRAARDSEARRLLDLFAEAVGLRDDVQIEEQRLLDFIKGLADQEF
jgi:hypothetical protein